MRLEECPRKLGPGTVNWARAPGPHAPPSRMHPFQRLAGMALLVVSAALPLGCAGGSETQPGAPPASPPALPPVRSGTPVVSAVVVARYSHDRNAFTQGLHYVGQGVLVESTGRVGSSGVRRVDLGTGRVLLGVPTPIREAFGEGVTVLEGVAYHLTWQTGVAFALDAVTLRELGRFAYSGEGWGLTHDGRSLVMSDGSSTLFWRDPETFAIIHQVQVTDGGQPVGSLNELEEVRGSVYANVWPTNRIARIDTGTGEVTLWLDVQALTREVSAAASGAGRPLTAEDVPNGIAFVPERGTLLLTGKRWPSVFEVQVPGTQGAGQAQHVLTVHGDRAPDHEYPAARGHELPASRPGDADVVVREVLRPNAVRQLAVSDAQGQPLLQAQDVLAAIPTVPVVGPDPGGERVPPHLSARTLARPRACTSCLARRVTSR